MHNNPTSSHLQQSKHQFLACGRLAEPSWVPSVQQSADRHGAFLERPRAVGQHTQKSGSPSSQTQPWARGHRVTAPEAPPRARRLLPLSGQAREIRLANPLPGKHRARLLQPEGPFPTSLPFDCVLTAKVAEPEPHLPLTRHRLPSDHVLSQKRRKCWEDFQESHLGCKISFNNGCERLR